MTPADTSPSTIGQEWARERITEAAIVSCQEHYDREHVNTIPPCAGAMQDARWWAVALGIAKWSDER